LQAQYFLPGVWPQRYAIGAGGRLQGRKRAIGLRLGQISHALLFDEVAGAGQQLADALNDPVEQPLELCRAGSARFMTPARPRCCDTPHRGPGNADELRLAAEPKRWMSVTAPL